MPKGYSPKRMGCGDCYFRQIMRNLFGGIGNLSLGEMGAQLTKRLVNFKVCGNISAVRAGPLAQLGEQGTLNPLVAGSSPVRVTEKATTFVVAFFCYTWNEKVVPRKDVKGKKRLPQRRRERKG